MLKCNGFKRTAATGKGGPWVCCTQHAHCGRLNPYQPLCRRIQVFRKSIPTFRTHALTDVTVPEDKREVRQGHRMCCCSTSGMTWMSVLQPDSRTAEQLYRYASGDVCQGHRHCGTGALQLLSGADC